MWRNDYCDDYYDSDEKVRDAWSHEGQSGRVEFDLGDEGTLPVDRLCQPKESGTSWYIVIDSSNSQLQYTFFSFNLLSMVDYGVVHLYY